MKTKTFKWRYLVIVIVSLIILLAVSFVICAKQADSRKKESAAFAESFKDTIVLKLNNAYNYTDALAITMTLNNNRETFNSASKQILLHDEVLHTEYFENDVLKYVYPLDSPRKNYLGMTFSELDSAYALTRIRGELVVEGPVIKSGKGMFLMIRPLFDRDRNGLLGDFIGEIAIVLKEDKLLEKLNLNQIEAAGYDYELWRVSPLDGKKSPISKSSSSADFTNATQVQFEMPTVWTLSIIPKEGWFSKELVWFLGIMSVITTVIIAALIYFYANKKELKRIVSLNGNVDFDTGLPNKNNLLSLLDTWTTNEGEHFVLIYMTIDNYNRYTQAMTAEQKQELRSHICNCLNGYIKSEHIVARVGEANFVLAFKESLTETEIENIKKGLSIEMIWKFTINGQKKFLAAECESTRFPKDGKTAAELLTLAQLKNYDNASRNEVNEL